MWRIAELTENLVRGTAHCHIACWREAYRGKVADHILDALDIDELAARWDTWRQGASRIRVAVEHDSVVGFANAGPTETGLHLYSLYVRRPYYGTGLAEELISAVTEDRPCTLWVLEDNPRAQSFYRRQGFAFDDTSRWDPIINARELRMVRGATLPTMTYVRIDDGVLHIAISTAAKGTSLDFGGVNAGTAALADLDRAVGAIVVEGSGPNFCAGGDVRAFASAPDRSEFLRALATDLHAFVRALDTAPVQVVVGVQGWAAGAGMSLVCSADVAIGGPSTKLKPAYTGIGLTPDGGMSWTLPRIVGHSRAKEIILSDAEIDADEAVRLGILARLVADDEIAAEAHRVAARFATGPRSAYGRIRALLAASRTSTLSDQLDRETESIAQSVDTPVGREGVDAFVAKRRPVYRD